MSPEVAFRLYAITDRKLVPGGNLSALLESLAGAGLRGLQLREKDMAEVELAALASSVRPVMERAGVQWLVNSSISLAESARASGVHLPASADPGAARRRLGPAALVGKSVHSAGEAREAASAGADFMLFGPVFDTPSKRAFGAPQGIERLREVCDSVGVPVFAVGGITPERVSAVLGAGAHGVAVVSGIMAAENPLEVLERYGRELGGL
jgi:thiamine-phosphate pyrophosphorylase